MGDSKEDHASEHIVESDSPWVFSSTDESILLGKISILSIIETAFAVSLYIFIALYFDQKWLLLISAFCAPIILLRSPESKKLGLFALKSFIDNTPRTDNDIHDSLGQIFSKGVSFVERFFVLFFSWLILVSVIYLFTYLLIY